MQKSQSMQKFLTKIKKIIFQILFIFTSLESKRGGCATVLIVREENKWMLRGHPEKGWNKFLITQHLS